MVSKASDDLPDPETPVTTVRALCGISKSMFFRLWTRAPRTMMLRLTWAPGFFGQALASRNLRAPPQNGAARAAETSYYNCLGAGALSSAGWHIVLSCRDGFSRMISNPFDFHKFPSRNFKTPKWFRHYVAHTEESLRHWKEQYRLAKAGEPL